jgi:hypothetical protein
VDEDKRGTNLFSLPKLVSRETKPEVEVELRDLLKDEEVASFFRYVHKNDLRQEALELLEKRLGQLE